MLRAKLIGAGSRLLMWNIYDGLVSWSGMITRGLMFRVGAHCVTRLFKISGAMAMRTIRAMESLTGLGLGH